MKKGASYKDNIEFLIMMYKRELSLIEQGKEKRTSEEQEMIETYIEELETIIELSK